MADRWEHATDGYPFRFFSPEQVDQILREGAQQGREGSHAAIERILKHEVGLPRTELWRRIRQLKTSLRQPCRLPSVWSPEDDRILRDGYQTGWQGKREAVSKLLKQHPDWHPHVIWKRARKLHLIQKISKRGQDRSHSTWSEHDNQTLLNLAGYKSSRAIARMLHRSEAAVRCHLMFLGKSSRVHLEGFSRHELATDLHFGKKTVQRLIVEGLLEVRDPRITRESLEHLYKSGFFRPAQLGDAPPSAPITPDSNRAGGLSAPGNPSAATKLSIPSGKTSRAQRVWAEVANSLGVPVETIKRLIANRVLKLCDPTITEKSLRDLCRHHGSLINCEFLTRETKEWLQNSMGFVPASGESSSCRLVPLRKHAQIIRRCAKCGQTMRGNVFFRHVKAD